MIQAYNIVKCKKCEAPLIYEELKIHECFTKKLVNISYDTDTNEFYLFDGKKWYRWFPNFSPKNQHPNGTPRDSTEPKNSLNSLSYRYLKTMGFSFIYLFIFTS